MILNNIYTSNQFKFPKNWSSKVSILMRSIKQNEEKENWILFTLAKGKEKTILLNPKSN